MSLIPQPRQTTMVELLTRFVYNGHGMPLFGLCVMALGKCDMNVWKV